MRKVKINLLSLSILVAVIVSCVPTSKKDKEIVNQETEITDPLPSWNEGTTKTSIINYVNDVVNVESENFITIPDRIATFDNDGNLWSEQPAYFQLFFAIDRVKALAADHPEWKTEQPFKAVLDDNMDELLKHGEHRL